MFADSYHLQLTSESLGEINKKTHKAGPQVLILTEDEWVDPVLLGSPALLWLPQGSWW